MVDVESDDPVKQSELEELKNKVSKMNKNLITIMNTVKNIEYNLNNKKEENKENTNDKDKERINKAFEKKQIGRPVGSWEDKRKQYFEWITTGKITQPKEETLAYYKINKDPSNKFHILNLYIYNMNLLELFSGTGSVGKVAKEYVVSLD